MKLHALRCWREKQTATRTPQVSPHGEVETIGVLSARLDGLLRDLDQIQCELGDLETQLQDRPEENKKGASLNYEKDVTHLGSEYWIG